MGKPRFDQWRIAATLTMLMEARGLSLREAARITQTKKDTLGRMLSAEIYRYDPPKVFGVAQLLGASIEVAQELFNMAVQTHDTDATGYRPMSSGSAEWLSPFASIEAEATYLDIYESEYITGLLQILLYMKEVNRVDPTLTAEWAAKIIDLKLRRQKLAWGSERPGGALAMRLILNEPCLLRIKGTSFFDAQISHLLEMVRRHEIGIYVLPLSRGFHSSMQASYSIMGFSHPVSMNLVYLESHLGDEYREDRKSVDHSRKLFTTTLTECVELGEYLHADQGLA
ncbi:Scr1 family TA system antitoxin-like transcriptional regulator [Glycomyces harbinensis]|nr:Scr1 family TA system antitoxin-like transcriptional regulator [Glycomyces harbinensis]